MAKRCLTTTHPVGGFDELWVLLHEALRVSPHRVSAKGVVLVMGVSIQDCTQAAGMEGSATSVG